MPGKHITLDQDSRNIDLLVKNGAGLTRHEWR